MPLDQDNALSYGIDTATAKADDTSVFSDLGNLVTKGVPLTALSILNSFANTGTEIANMFSSADNQQELASIPKQLGDGDYADYYSQHAEGIEAAGLVAGSLIPGTLGIKGFKYGTTALTAYRAARAGELTGAISRATGLLPGFRKAELIRDSLAAISQDGVQAGLTANKFKAIALGFGDQALQGAIYQAATYATMNQSPLLQQDDFWDVVNFIKDGALVGGAVGGLIDGIGTRALFNRAIRDANTKAVVNLAHGELGQGAYTAGDRAATYVNTLYDQPAAFNDLSRANQLGSTDKSTASIRGLAMDMSGGDKDLADGFTTASLKMRANGTTKDEAYDKLGGLSFISRIGEEPKSPGFDPGASNTGEVFYLTRFTRTSDDEPIPAISKVISNQPQETDKWSLAYRLKQGSTSFNFASSYLRATDEAGNAGQPLYPTAKSAWEAGMDVWVGKDNKIFINPNAPNIEQAPQIGQSRSLSRAEQEYYNKNGRLPPYSKPLYGGQLNAGARLSDISKTAPATYLRFSDGSILNGIDATAADYGQLTANDSGVTVGSKFIPMSLDKISATTDSLHDATARFAWSFLRGVKRGDAIDPNDIPMLERLYEQVSKNGPDWLAKNKVTVTGANIAADDNALGTIGHYLHEAKNQLIGELLNAGDKSTNEIALRAGVPSSWLENNMPAQNINELISQQSTYTTPQHARLWYNISNLSVDHGNILRGALDFQYRQQLIRDAMESAVAANIGDNYADFKINRPASAADINGAGPSFLGFARAAYNSLAQEAERVGRMFSLWSKDEIRTINEKLTLSAQRIRSMPGLSAELRSYFTGLQSTGEKYLQLPAELSAKYFPDLEQGKTVRVLLSALARDNDQNIIDWDAGKLPNGFQDGAKVNPNIRAPLSYYTLSKEASEFMDVHTSLNDARIYAINKLHAAWGTNKQLMAGLDYAPPIDTSKYNYIAYVKPQEGSLGNDGGVGVLTARTADELQQKAMMAQGQGYQVFTKQQLKDFHKAEGDYQSNLLFNQSAVDSTMRRVGILNEIQPNMQPERLIDDIVNWHTKQQIALGRANVETLNSQLFAELKAMGETSGRFDTSTANLASTISGIRGLSNNPYTSYVNTALAVSAKERYSFWSQTQDKIEAFGDTAFQLLHDTFASASRNLISWEKAHEITSKFGLGNPYQAGVDALAGNRYLAANQLPPQPYLRNFLSKVNSVMGTLVIKLDPFQQLLHAISTPIMALTEAQSVAKFISTELPNGSGVQIPTPAKVLFSSVRNLFDQGTVNQWKPVYSRLGLLLNPDMEYQFRQIMDNVRLPNDGLWDKATQRLNNAVQTAQRFTGTNWSEYFTSWMAADVGRQLFEAAGYSGKQLEDNIVSFATRVKGNFIASQRPVAFQGPIGQAVGLFQTYQTNLYQNFFRYVADGEGKTIATLVGAQAFLFGMSSLPGFAAMNNIIVGNFSGNPAHKDIYGATYNLVDKKLGDYLLYGAASNLLNANFFTRGDVNPRNITFLPINPLQWPAVRGAINMYNNLAEVSTKISQGGSTGASMLMALEHNGLNRPLQGLAQLAQGYSTTSKGQLISRVYPDIQDSNTMGLNELWNAGVFSRLVGARPLDEAIVNDAVYRKTIATATDAARMETLGESVKSTLYGHGVPTDDQLSDFMHEYMKSGGNIKNFSRSLLHWSQQANTAVANNIYRQLQQPRNINLMQVMGGQPMPDFTVSPSPIAQNVE